MGVAVGVGVGVAGCVGGAGGGSRTRLVMVKPRLWRLATTTTSGWTTGSAQVRSGAGGASSRSVTVHAAPAGIWSDSTRAAAPARSFQVLSAGVTSSPPRLHSKPPSKNRSWSTTLSGSTRLMSRVSV